MDQLLLLITHMEEKIEDLDKEINYFKKRVLKTENKNKDDLRRYLKQVNDNLNDKEDLEKHLYYLKLVLNGKYGLSEK